MFTFRRRNARYRNPLIIDETARMKNPLIPENLLDDQTVYALMKDASYPWRKVQADTPGFFMQLLRSDELRQDEMIDFRKAASDWAKRDSAIAIARHDGGLFLVHPYSHPNSEWATRNQVSPSGPSVPNG